VHVSCKSGTGFVWYQILAPIGTLFYSKPVSGVHVTEMITCDWLMIILYVFMRIRIDKLPILFSAYLWVYVKMTDSIRYGRVVLREIERQGRIRLLSTS